MINRNFIDSETGLPTICKLIIAGNGDVPKNLINCPDFPSKLKTSDILFNIKVNELNISSLLEHSEIIRILSSVESSLSDKDTKILNYFLHSIDTNSQKITYGLDAVLFCLKSGLVQHLLVDDKFYSTIDLKSEINLFKPNLIIIPNSQFNDFKIGAILWYEFSTDLTDFN
jgi:hypothetical protein